MHDLRRSPENWRRVKIMQKIEGFYSFHFFTSVPWGKGHMNGF